MGVGVVVMELIGSDSPHIKQQNNSTQLKWKSYCLLQGVCLVGNGQCMRLVSGVIHQKIWCFINGHVIHAELHRAKQVVVKVQDMNGLMYQQ
jgi:hypothetical protein